MDLFFVAGGKLSGKFDRSILVVVREGEKGWGETGSEKYDHLSRCPSKSMVEISQCESMEKTQSMSMISSLVRKKTRTLSTNCRRKRRFFILIV